MLKVAILLVALVISIALIPHNFVQAATSSDVKKKVIDAISRQVEGDWSHLKLVIIREAGQARVTVYNTTKPITPPVTPPPPVPPPTCLPNQHLENGVCVANPPTPTGNISKVCLLGDIDGTSITSKMTGSGSGCNLKIGLGDLTYKSDLADFKKLNFNRCVIGNHDAPEDGSSSIYTEALAYCGDSWYQKIGKATLVMGFNTNGDLTKQVSTASNVLLNTETMKDIKTLAVVTHKPCYTNPNAHHPVEAKVKTFCDKLQANTPTGVKTIYIAAHNHVLSSTVDQTKFTAGGGGRSHYSCGTDTVWTFCDAENYGYLELTVDNNNGNTVGHFIGSDGKVLH